MFALNYTPFGTGQDFSSNYYTTNSYYRMDLTSGKFDEIKVDEEILPYNNAKEDWSYNTILLSKFNGDLEGGNLQNNSMQIELLRLKRRESTSLHWDKLHDFTYDKDIELYEFIDSTIKSATNYTYALCPVTTSIEGKNSTASIDTSFDKLFLVDKSGTIAFEYNLNYSDIETIGGFTEIETLGSKYPFTIEDNLDYRKSQVKSLIVSDATVDACGNIDKVAELANRKTIHNFLNNRKVKLLKDGTGNYFLVKVNNIKLSPNNELQQLIYDVSFNWIEVADAEDFSNFSKLNII